MSNDNIVVMPFGHYPKAQCSCGSVVWYVYVDKEGTDFQRLIGISCDECGEEIIFNTPEGGRFPVGTTNLTIPWEIAEQAAKNFVRANGKCYSSNPVKLFGSALLPDELDTWYGKHWREVAE